jgi:hypothetical protein
MRIDIKGVLNGLGSAKAAVDDMMTQQAPLDNTVEAPVDPAVDDGTDTAAPEGGMATGGAFITGLLEANVKLRMLHWNTTSFSAHTALGKAYEGLNEQIDEFIETYIGARGRDLLMTVSSLAVSAEEEPSAVLDSLEGLLRNDIQADLGESETALLNMRDEMLGLVQHTKYLLTLQ